ncbi:hypothetical protein JHD50_03560 [Sulfurimonas sp. MAG313]|nr:hypothetical protein [Sulfurimonas sp. MAG313]MDF1880388.1 hypothetical protein [Sulfurimonas sp. MAG313]
MRRIYELNTERKSEISEEELPDTDEDYDYFQPEDNNADNEVDDDNEREYCD